MLSSSSQSGVDESFDEANWTTQMVAFLLSMAIGTKTQIHYSLLASSSWYKVWDRQKNRHSNNKKMP
jgi:hypothetical protein